MVKAFRFEKTLWLFALTVFLTVPSSISLANGSDIKNALDFKNFPTVTIPKENYDDFYEDCMAYGFTVDKNVWIPASTKSAGAISTSQYAREFYKYSYQYKDNGILNYQSDFAYAALRSKSSSKIYGIIYRAILSPLQPGRNIGLFGIGSYGDNWYARGVDTKIEFANGYQMESWAPQNSPSKTTGTIGVGLDSNDFSITASVNFAASELKVTSKSNYATNVYQTVYTVSGYGDYAANSVVFYGMAIARSETAGKAFACTIAQSASYNGKEYHGDCVDSFGFSLEAA